MLHESLLWQNSPVEVNNSQDQQLPPEPSPGEPHCERVTNEACLILRPPQGPISLQVTAAAGNRKLVRIIPTQTL
jgi:hypothetical protein